MGGDKGAATQSSGNAGFAGYDYQIEATVWLALELMVARSVTDEVVIEPPSQEDVEATIQDAGKAELRLCCADSPSRHAFQMKRRSSAPWSASDLAKVITQGEVAQARKSPLEMLEADKRMRFVLITNETTAKRLRPFEVEDVQEVSEATSLPRGVRTDLGKSARAALARRVSVHGRVTEEVLASRIGQLLSSHGHVAAVDHEACVAELREAVRRRMRGSGTGSWKRDELIEELVRYGGSVTPRRAMDHYVRPRCFEQIEATLETLNAVVIAGPSGTGKTLTAEVLEDRMGRSDPPFDVVDEEKGPSHIARELLREDAVLFHLRDPWGPNRLVPGADAWSGELPKLLSRAGTGKKFVVTSRSDVMHSAGPSVVRELRRYTVAIEPEDYGRDRLGQIYDGIASDLMGSARAAAVGCRDTVLNALNRPYEVDRFLVGLSSAPDRPVTELVSESEIEAISGVIAKQLAPSGSEGAASAAIIWALMTARGTVSRSVLSKLRRAMGSIDSSFRPDVEGIIDFLVAGRNVRQERTMLAFHHPRVAEGLRVAFEVHLAEAEYALSLAVAGLVAMDEPDEDWGVEMATVVLRAAADLGNASMEINVKPAVQKQIDEFLEERLVKADDGHGFRNALRDLARFGKSPHVPSRLAQMLVVGAERGGVTVMGVWRAPSLSTEQMAEIADHPLTSRLVRRFVREVLTESATNYGDGLNAFLEELDPGIEDAFWEVLEEVADRLSVCDNIRRIVQGACAGESADFERAIGMLGRAYEQVDSWLDGAFGQQLRDAEEHEVDAALVDRILEEPEERLFNPTTGMEAVVRLRGAREGAQWIVGHRYRKVLIRVAAKLIRDGQLVPRPGELRLLLDEAEDWERQAVWDAAERHWDVDLSEALRRELVMGGARLSYRESLVRVAHCRDGDGADWIGGLAEVVRLASEERQLEIVFDILAAGRDPGSYGIAAGKAVAETLSEMMSEPVGELARLMVALSTGTEDLEVADGLSGEARYWLRRHLNVVGNDVAGVLGVVGARIGIDAFPAGRRLLDVGDAEHGVRAVEVLKLDGGEAAMRALVGAMDHGKYHVRVAALEAVATRASASDKTRIVGMASDRSADVRLAFARAMERHHWPEAVDALVELLGDERDFSMDYSATWSRFGVARAAARALGAYEDLPVNAMQALLDAAREESRDPFVGCEAIEALATREAEGVEKLIIESLGSSGLAGTPQIRPKVQAAAWAVFDRACVQRSMAIDNATIEMATEDRVAVAGPLLMAIGVLGGDVRSTVLDDLDRRRNAVRGELVRVAAAAAAETAGVSLRQSERLLARLAEKDGQPGLSDEERNALERWSLGLDPKRDVQQFTAWIAQSVFGLTVSEEVGDPRKFETPGSIPVATLRSWSSLRESEIPGP